MKKVNMTNTTKLKYNNLEFEMCGLSDDDLMFRRFNENNSFYELDLLKFVESLNLSGTFVDVGANIGNHSIWIANFTNFKKVISIEGHPKIFEVLRKNCEKNINNIESVLINKPVLNTKKIIEFGAINKNNVGGTHIINEDSVKEIDDGLKFENLFNPVEMESDTLDNLLTNEEKIDFIKMDIEGCERLAMEGCMSILKKHKPYLSTEFWDRNELNLFKDSLKDLNYKVIKSFGNNYIWSVK